jgi:hypothetical protein
MRTKPYAQGGTPLTLAIARLTTLTVHGNYNRKGCSPKSGDGLAAAIRKMPTRAAQDAKNNAGPSQMGRNTLPLNAEIGGPLNPEWCEWFMGWPIGWTELPRSETGKCHSKRLSHGSF